MSDRQRHGHPLLARAGEGAGGRRMQATRQPWGLLALLAAMSLPALAQVQAPAPADGVAAAETAAATSEPVRNSAMNDRLLYQLLIGEMALNQGDAATAYEWILDAARRTRDEGLFRRAVNVALQARAGDQALSATRAWRQALPTSSDALRTQLQILLVLNRSDALAEPLRTLLAQSPASERPGLIASLPRFLQRANDPPRVAALITEVLKPYLDEPGTRVSAHVTTGRAWMDAGEPDRALALVRQAQAMEPDAPGPVLLALELMRQRPEAEALVLQYLQRTDAVPALRMAYVRVLTAGQRYAEAAVQLETATRLQPDVAPPFLSLGALYLELKQTAQGETALRRYIELAQTGAADSPAAASASPVDPATSEAEPGADGEEARSGQGLVQAWLMLAQSAEQRGDFSAAEAWLAKVGDSQRALEVQSRRASILARQGQVAQARELIRQVPERSPEDARAKLMAEAGVLRDLKRWSDAFDVLGSAVQRFSDDTDLIYEQAMMAEKLDRLDEMERLLRRVIELKPDNAHAHNALGYSLADRKLRLPEARQLIERALALSPGDPFITDSLGWVEYRLGNHADAVRLLRQAYAARPDTEIGAHLGEVLWAMGQRDEARRVWRDAKARDAGNDVLRETLARLQVEL